MVRIGVWEGGEFIGVVIFSRGAAPHIGDPFRLDQTEVCELTRIALREHEAPVSQIATRAVRLLRSASPGLRLIVSYADPAQGHAGTIYQAMNWIYVGETVGTTEYIDKAGRRWHSRMVSPTGWKKVYGQPRRVVTPAECRAVKMPGKHKYLLPLDRRTRALVEPLRKPYPRAECPTSS